MAALRTLESRPLLSVVYGFWTSVTPGTVFSRLREIGGRGAEARVVVLEVLAGQQDHLALLLLVGLLVGLVGVAGLADAELGLLERVGGDAAAEVEGDDDEGQPAEDGGLPMTGRPAADTCCEVALGTHGVALLKVVGRHGMSVVHLGMGNIGARP